MLNFRQQKPPNPQCHSPQNPISFHNGNRTKPCISHFCSAELLSHYYIAATGSNLSVFDSLFGSAICALRIMNDGLDELLAAVPPTPDSDADLELCFQLAIDEDIREDRYVRRGHRLCRMMRKCKRLIADAREKAIAPHTAAKIARHNQDHAVRPEDRIVLEQRREPRLKGTGRRAACNKHSHQTCHNESQSSK